MKERRAPACDVGREGRRLAGAFMGAVMLLPLATASGAAPPIKVEVLACPAEITARLAADVAREIDVLLREQDKPAPPPDAVVIRCLDETAQLTVVVGDQRRETTVALGSLAVEHRARAVGLAAAELVQATLNAQSPAAPAPPQPSPAPAAPLPSASLALRELSPPASHDGSTSAPSVAVGGLAQWLGRPSALLLGARVAVHAPLAERLSAVLSADAAAGSVDTAAAVIDVRAFSAGLHLQAGWSAGRVRFEAGPGARIGWVQLSGRPVATATSLEGAELSGAWGGPELRARLAFRPSDRRSLRIAVELGGGLVTRPVRGLRDGSERVLGIEGPWLSLGLALALGASVPESIARPANPHRAQ